jgi:FADH2 O2-dependent halogenase
MRVSREYDVAILGSGFGGSLLSMIARRARRSVVLLERGRHPRFAIGESSTPLANLALEELADRYDLPRLKPLAKWGTWQDSYPQIPCGLKRGFSFFAHVLGGPAPDPSDRDRQLLVAASPNDRIADTHWYRADLDHFLVREAQAIGVDYVDEVRLDRMCESEQSVRLEGERCGRPFSVRARFLVDATGPRGFVHGALGLAEASFPGFPQTEALFSHFSGVAPMGSESGSPYAVDNSAIHHVFDGGWIWVLRFNNGITSAGAAVSKGLADQLQLREGAEAWRRLLDLLPGVGKHFAGAKAELPFTRVPHLSFLSSAVAAKRWAMLPSAAAFTDPLLSTGFPLTLFGVMRLGEIISESWDSPEFTSRLAKYAEATREEALATSRLIGALYGAMHNFPLFTALSFLYFAAASFSEAARRLGHPQRSDSFLLCRDPVFGPVFYRLCDEARQIRTQAESDRLRARILAEIEPFNIAGLGQPGRRNWFPVDPDDLFRGAGKLAASRREVERLLERSGFSVAGLAASREDPIVPASKGRVP